MNLSRRSLLSGIVHSLLILSLTFGSLAAHAADAKPASAPKTSVKLLTVGNSFAVNSTHYLPDLAKAGGKTLILLNCYKGGCSLKQHADAIAATEKNPNSPASQIYVHSGSLASNLEKSKHFNLKEALLSDKWEVITVQQYSAESYKPETYEPYAKQVIDTVRQYAPQAEIVVHETWAYRSDDPLFKKSDLTAEKMYQALKAAYAKLATDYKLRTIPVGNAFHNAEQSPLWQFKADTTFDFANAKEGQLPNQTGSLHNGWHWAPDKTTGIKKLNYDGHHAGLAGEYLGAAVFYEFLYQDDVRKADFTPKGLTPEQAADLRRIAHETLQAQLSQPTP
jgi:hypothetical protein